MSKRIVLLLLFFVHSTTSAAIPAKRAFDQKEFVDKLNELRAEVAKGRNIGNMHELSFDSGLEKIAKEMAKTCNFGPGKYVFISAEQMFGKSQEVLHPLQTQLACVEMVAPCSTRNVEHGFCLLGPHDDGYSDKLLKMGPPGSHCDGKLADNGLCKGGSGSSQSSGGSGADGSETKAAAQMNSIILAIAFAIVMIFP